MTENSEIYDPDILLNKLHETEGLDKASVLADLTVAFREINPERVIEFGKQGLELLQDTKDEILESIILNELCWAYQCIGEYQTALECGFIELGIASESVLPAKGSAMILGTGNR